MMNLLIDFITLQKKTGAGEYIRRIFHELIKYMEIEHININIYALFDSSKPIAYNDMCQDALSKTTFLDVSQTTIDKLIEEYSIDKFFIGCAQYIGIYSDVTNIRCKVICVVHDLAHEEKYVNKIGVFYKLLESNAEEKPTLSLKEKLNRKLFHPHTYYDKFSEWYVREAGNKYFSYALDHMENILRLYHNNPKFRFIAVSEYTKSTMAYNWDIPMERIDVLYSPERILLKKGTIDNPLLADLIATNRKYYLLVSAHAIAKNATKAIHAFSKYYKITPDVYLVTIGYHTDNAFANHINIDFLSESDLANAYENCYALIYPSFFEGFGYPPIEAMHYGKPVLCSNTTSMPFVLGDAPIYFSPLYESAIFNALLTLTDENYKLYSHKSQLQYKLVHDRQESDLKKLIRLTVNE